LAKGQHLSSQQSLASSTSMTCISTSSPKSCAMKMLRSCNVMFHVSWCTPGMLVPDAPAPASTSQLPVCMCPSAEIGQVSEPLRWLGMCESVRLSVTSTTQRTHRCALSTMPHWQAGTSMRTHIQPANIVAQCSATMVAPHSFCARALLPPGSKSPSHSSQYSACVAESLRPAPQQNVPWQR
jgi:hypothetical protein